MQSAGIRTRLSVSFHLATSLVLLGTAFAQDFVAAKKPAFSGKAVNRLELPLAFEANQGQTDSHVRFLSRGAGYAMFLSQDEAVVSVAKSVAKKSSAVRADSFEDAGTLHLKLEGANPRASIGGEQQFTGKSNYYLGNDAKQWRTGIPNFGRVRYQSVYPGIDLVYYGNQRVLEHDFVVAAGADPSRIRMAMSGAKSLQIEQNGDLVMDLGQGNVRLLKPEVYQEFGGKRHAVDGRYKLLADNRVSFELGRYDRRHQLVIDPKLNYSTFLGGNANDSAFAVATSGSTVYLAGMTYSAGFPTVNPAQQICASCQGNPDAFVTAFNNGNLVYSTYLGGDGMDQARGIAVNSTGTAFVGGFTASTNFPANGSGLPTTRHGGSYDGFITELSPSGTMNRSGFFGGSGEDQILGLAFDNNTSRIAVTGYTTSTDFPLQSFTVPLLTGQIYRTTVGGPAWIQTSGTAPNNLGMMDAQAMLITGSTSETYYAAGTGGVYQSTDGSNWAPMNAGLPPENVTCLVEDKSVAGGLYACTTAGVFRFDPTNGAWQAASNGLPSAQSGTIVFSVLVDPVTPTTVYAGTLFGAYVSTDSGANWSLLGTGLPSAIVRSLAMDSSHNLYAGLDANATSKLIFKLNGGTWTALAGAGLAVTGVNGNSLTIDQSNGKIYVGLQSSGGYTSGDGGATFSFLNGVPSAVNAFAIVSSSHLFAATESGVYNSTDGGSTWARFDSGFTAISVRTLAFDPLQSAAQGGTILYAGVFGKQGFTAGFDNSMSFIYSFPMGGDGISTPFGLDFRFPFYGNDGGPTSGGTEGHGVAFDPSGNLYVVGKTASTNIPGLSAQSPIFYDGFISKFSSAGAPQWSNLIGPAGTQIANAVAANATGVYVGGITYGGLDTLNAFASGCTTTLQDCGFLGKYDGAGTKQFMTFFGGDRTEIYSLALDSNSNVFLAGRTFDLVLPQVNPLGNSPGPVRDIGFVSEFNPNGTTLLFSSILGGTTAQNFGVDSVAYGVAVDSANSPYVVGSAFSSDFPTSPNAFSSAYQGTGDAFVMQLTSTGNSSDLALTVTPLTPTTAMGAQNTFNITINNLTSTGTGAPNAALITNFTLDGLTSPNGTCTPVPAQCSFGTIPPSGQVTATALVTYPSQGTFKNFVAVRSDDDDPNAGNNQQNVTATVTAPFSDLGINITAPANIPRASQFNYVVTVTNNGPSATASFNFIVNLDSNAIVFDLPSECSLDFTVATCSVEGLNAGQSLMFTFLVQAAFSQTTMTSSATVTLAGDPNASNNTSMVTSTVTKSADLFVNASSQGFGVVGAPTEIDLQFGTLGLDDATNTVLTIPLPSEVTFKSATGMTCTGATTLTCSIGNLQVDGDQSATLFVTVNRTGSITLLGTISATELDPDQSNNTFSTTVSAAPTSFAGESYIVSETGNGTIAIYPGGTSFIGGPNRMKAGSGPVISAIDMGGRYGYFGTSAFSNYISVVDFSIGEEVARIRGAVGRPMVLTPDGSRLIARVPGVNSESLAIVDTNTWKVINTVNLDGSIGDQIGKADIVVNSGVVANNKLYLQVTGTGNPAVFTVVVVNLANFSVSEVTGARTGQIVNQKHSIAASADGTRVYALRKNPTELLAINTSTDAVLQTLPLPTMSNPNSIAVTKDPNDPAGQFAYIVGRGTAPANLLLAVDLKTLTLLNTQGSLTFQPTNIVLSADGSYVHMFREGDMSGGNNGAFLSTPNFRSGGEFAIQEYPLGFFNGVSLGFVSQNTLDFTPSIDTVTPSVVNDTSFAQTMVVTGSAFSPGATIKIGNLDPQPATFVSSGRLTTTIPAGIAEQDNPPIIVTQPNPQELQTRRNVSGVLEGGFTVTTPFQLPNPLAILRYGESRLNVTDQTKNGSTYNTLINPLTVNITPDGKVAYLTNGLLTPLQGTPVSFIQALSLVSGNEIARIAVPNDAPGNQDGFAVSTDPVDGKPVLYFVSIDNFASPTPNDQLTIIDLDPASPTYHQVKRTIKSAFGDYSASWTLVATPDGKFVYATTDSSNPVNPNGPTRLLQFDTLNGTVTKLDDILDAFGAEPFPNHMRMTSDGNWVILPGNDGSVKAVNVSGRNISAAGAINFTDPGKSFKNFQVAGAQLFAFDANNNTVTAFHFDPANANFAKMGSVVVPGPGSVYEGAMAVDPAGQFVYVSIKDEDSIAVLDANKIAASDPAAMVAKGRSGLGIEDIKIPQALPLQTVDLGIITTPSPSTIAVGSNIFVSSNVNNNGATTATNVHVHYDIPANITLLFAGYSNSNGSQSASCPIVGTAVDCIIPNLDNGSTISVTLFSDVVQAPGTYNFGSTVSSDQGDTNQVDNTSNTSVQVVLGADLSATGQIPTGPFQTGDSVQFTATVVNNGPDVATNVQISLGANLDNLVITPPNGITCSFGNCFVAVVVPNTPLNFTLNGNVPAQPSISLSVYTNSSQSIDPNFNNNSFSASAPVSSSGGSSVNFLISDAPGGTVSSAAPSNIIPFNEFSVGISPSTTLVMPNGRIAFVINYNAGYISVYDLSIHKELKRIQGIEGLSAVLTPDASQLVVFDRFTNSFVVIDTATFTALRGISNGGAPVFTMAAVGTKIFFMRNQAAPISVLDLSNDTITPIAGTNMFERWPGHIAVTPDGATVVAVGGGSPQVPATLVRINAATNAVLQTLPLPTNTTTLTLAVSPSGPNVYAFVSMDNLLQQFDLTTGSPTLGQFIGGVNIDLGLSPHTSAITPDGAFLGFVQGGHNVFPNAATLDLSTLGEPFIRTSIIGSSLNAITAATLDPLPAVTAPQITSVTPAVIVNDAPITLEVDGINFSPDALVKVGAANPIPATFIDSTRLTVTLPQYTPSGHLDVVVINQNGGQALNSRNEAGIWFDNQLEVDDAAGYSGQWDTFTANYGSANGTITRGTEASTQPAGAGFPWGVGVTSNGIVFGTSNADQSVISSFSQEGPAFTPLSGQPGYGDSLIIVPDPTTSRTVALVPSANTVNQATDWQLNVIDADPFSPTVNSIIRTIPANSGGATTNPNGFTATPDGKFGFGFFNAPDNTGRLAVYNLITNQATVLTGASLGVDDFVQGMAVSPDSKYLAIANNFVNTIKVFSITNPTAPTLVQTYTPTVPEGAITSCCNMRWVGTRLFVFDPGSMLLQTFSFDPANSNFNQLGTIQIPGDPDPTWQGGLAISPDGNTAYVAQYANDSIGVFDANLAAASSPFSMITRIATGTGPVSIGLNPVPSFADSADVAVFISHDPDPVAQGTDLTYTLNVYNFGPSTTGNLLLSDDLPQGMTISQINSPSYITCTGSGTAALRCPLGTVPTNSGFDISITVHTSNAPLGNANNSARVVAVQSTVPDPDTTNNTAIDNVLIGLPDLTVFPVQPDNTHPVTNSAVTYAVTITNNGSVPATNIGVIASVDSGNILDSVDCGADGAAYCFPGDLQPGQSLVLHIKAQMPSNAIPVNLTVDVSEDQNDGNTNDNEFIYNLQVQNPMSADLVLTPGTAPVVINGVPTYTVTVTNNGPDTAQNVKVKDLLDRYQFVAASASTGTCSFDGVSVICNLGDMAVDASVNVNVSVIPPNSGWATNEFAASSDTMDANPGDNVAALGPFGGTVGNTRAGANVSVDALDSGSGDGVNFMFANVTRPGLTAASSTAGAQPPAGYRFGQPARVFDLSTTASYAGAIQVTLQMAGTTFHHPGKVRLFHMENGAWVDRTSAVDTARGMVSGVTTSLSPFILAEPVNAVPVANAGSDQVTPAAGISGKAVALSGAGSTDGDGDTLSYRWTGPFAEGGGSVTGAAPTVTLPLGASKLTLVVNDGEVDSTPVSLNVVVSDFLLAAPPTQVMLKRGQSATFEVAVTPKFGAFDAAVSLACTNLPVGVTCSIANNAVTPGMLGATATVTLTAGANAGLRGDHSPIFAFWMGGLPIFGILMSGPMSRRPKNRRGWALLVVLLILVIGMVACGGGGPSFSNPTPTPTQTSTTTVTVSGTAGGLQHTATATVVIQ